MIKKEISLLSSGRFSSGSLTLGHGDRGGAIFRVENLKVGGGGRGGEHFLSVRFILLNSCRICSAEEFDGTGGDSMIF